MPPTHQPFFCQCSTKRQDKTLLLRSNTSAVLLGNSWILVFSFFSFLKENLWGREGRFEWKSEGNDKVVNWAENIGPQYVACEKYFFLPELYLKFCVFD